MALGTEQKLELSIDNYRMLEAVAEQAGKDVSRYTNESAELGIDLANTALEVAPIVLRIGFQLEDEVFDLYPLEFGPCVKDTVPAELADLEAAFSQEKVPLPLDKRLLVSVTDIAMILCVERTNFMESALFFRWQWGIAQRADKEIILSDADGDYSVLDPNVF